MKNYSHKNWKKILNFLPIQSLTTKSYGGAQFVNLIEIAHQNEIPVAS